MGRFWGAVLGAADKGIAMDQIIASRARLDGLIVDDRAAGRFKVHRSVFTNDEVFKLERARVFERCWLYLGHVSEVRQPYDFVTRKVAGRQLILNRNGNGELGAYYNCCPHRGALVCRERGGSRKSFQCAYHGWTFDGNGKLRGVPRAGSYPEGFNADGELDLLPVENLAEYCGFIFVNFLKQPEQSLVDYLAGATEILELVALQGADGMEIVGGVQEYAVAANWKLLQENSADGYHAAATHATYFDYVKSRDGAPKGFDPTLAFGGVRNLGNGHAVSESVGAMPWGRPYARWVPGFGEAAKCEMAEIAQGVFKRLPEEQANQIVNGDRNTLIFPNLVINDIMAVTVRTFYPTAPGHMDVTAWALAPVGESDTSRERRNRNFLEFLGPAGFATPDDVEMLAMCQDGYANIAACEWNDISRGMLAEKPAKSDEYQMRTFWRRWHELMRRPAVGETA